MNAKERYKAVIEVAIAKAKAMHDLATVSAPDGAEVYAYPHRAGIRLGCECCLDWREFVARDKAAGWQG